MISASHMQFFIHPVPVAAPGPGRDVRTARNPPIRRVDLSATRYPRLSARSGRCVPGRRRAGRFVQVQKERSHCKATEAGISRTFYLNVR